jgi:hypothetical protein
MCELSAAPRSDIAGITRRYCSGQGPGIMLRCCVYYTSHGRSFARFVVETDDWEARLYSSLALAYWGCPSTRRQSVLIGRWRFVMEIVSHPSRKYVCVSGVCKACTAASNTCLLPDGPADDDLVTA